MLHSWVRQCDHNIVLYKNINNNCMRVCMCMCMCVYIYNYYRLYYNDIYIYIYTTGPLNAWIWLADECSKVQSFLGKRTDNVVPGRSWPHYMTISLRQMILLFQRSYNRKITKTHNDTGQKNKYSKQKDKIDRSCPCFCHKITFYVRRAHTFSVSLS